MENGKNRTICPVERAGMLDTPLRKLFQNPQRILKPHIKAGMTVLDLGCGPGFFSIEIAKMLNGSGKVIAADLQDGMLEIVNKKIQGTELEQRIEIHKCGNSEIGVTQKVNFILAFYMIHEVPNQEKLFEELKSILKPGGIIYIIEPKMEVSMQSFEEMIKRVKNIGFEIVDKPRVSFSRAVLLSINN